MKRETSLFWVTLRTRCGCSRTVGLCAPPFRPAWVAPLERIASPMADPMELDLSSSFPVRRFRYDHINAANADIPEVVYVEEG